MCSKNEGGEKGVVESKSEREREMGWSLRDTKNPLNPLSLL